MSHVRMISSNSFFARNNGSSGGTKVNTNFNSIATNHRPSTPSNNIVTAHDHDHPHYYNSNNVDDVLTVVEYSLRTLVIYAVIYTAGMQTADRAVLVGIVRKVLELTCVAWGTCLVIIALVWFQKSRMVNENVVVDADTTAALNTRQRSADYLNGEPTRADEQQQQLVHATTHQNGSTLDAELISDDSNYHRNVNSPTITTTATNQTRVTSSTKRTISQSLSSSSSLSFMPPNLQQLEHLYIMLIGSNDQDEQQHTRLSPNGVPVKIDTELFSGEMLLMFRTSQVDDNDNNDHQYPDTNTNNNNIDPTANYFKGKQRRFEWQWQIKLKKIPTGDVYVGCELDEPPAMGMIQRAL
eukprot:scaffold115683_cov23-Cyclotella_meneghiniana.AAC.1